MSSPEISLEELLAAVEESLGDRGSSPSQGSERIEKGRQTQELIEDLRHQLS